jgi:1-acyl-sn-glycerol-3-phosphate acyltransferase
MKESKKQASLIRSLIFGTGQWLTTIIFAPLSLLLFPFSFPTRYRVVSQWARFNIWWLEKSVGLKSTIEGLENIPDTPCIVMCKHQSAWETLALQSLFRPQAWVLKRSLLWIPFFGWGLAMLRPIAIDRSSGKTAVNQIIVQGRERLQSGCWVVIFPEGTRIPAGEKGRYRLGGAVLAAETGYPVVPVAHNAGEYWPRNSFSKSAGTIRMVIGKTIRTEGKKAGEIIAEVEVSIESEMDRITTLK